MGWNGEIEQSTGKSATGSAYECAVRAPTGATNFGFLYFLSGFSFFLPLAIPCICLLAPSRRSESGGFGG